MNYWVLEGWDSTILAWVLWRNCQPDSSSELKGTAILIFNIPRPNSSRWNGTIVKEISYLREVRLLSNLFPFSKDSQLVCFKLCIPYFCHQDNSVDLTCGQWSPFCCKNRKMFSAIWPLVRAMLWIILTFFFWSARDRTQDLTHITQVFYHWGMPLIPPTQILWHVKLYLWVDFPNSKQE